MTKNSQKKKGRERDKGRREKMAKKERKPEEPGLGFTKKNYALFGIGLVTIALGFLTLARGSITLAPILLVLGYCVLIPVAILLK